MAMDVAPLAGVGFGASSIAIARVSTVRISKPGRRIYSRIADLPRSYNGLGISILSTPRGVMSDNEARVAKVGGEVLCRVF